MVQQNSDVLGSQRRHTEHILRVLSRHGALSRSEIASRVGVSRTTLSELTTMLLEQGAIVVTATDADLRTGRGRPAERLALDPAAGQFMGVDFGRGRVHVAVADAGHNIIASGGLRYRAISGWGERMSTAFELIQSLSDTTGTHYSVLRGVGIGFPGPLSPHAGTAGDSRSQAYECTSDTVSTRFAERFGTRVTIDNNNRFAALAEASWGRNTETENLLYLRISDGIGGGIIAGGHLLAGGAGFAAELGHVTVELTGRDCHCGKRGCLETVASVPAVLERCRAAGASVATIDELRRAVSTGDPIVADVLRDIATAIGRVVGAAAVAVNPSEIVLAGDLISVAPAVLQHAANVIGYELLPMLTAAPIVRAARLGDDAGALGALVALFHQSPLLADYPDTSPSSTVAHTNPALRRA